MGTSVDSTSGAVSTVGIDGREVGVDTTDGVEIHGEGRTVEAGTQEGATGTDGIETDGTIAEGTDGTGTDDGMIAEGMIETEGGTQEEVTETDGMGAISDGVGRQSLQSSLESAESADRVALQVSVYILMYSLRHEVQQWGGLFIREDVVLGSGVIHEEPSFWSVALIW